MENKEILEKSIKRAEKGGWNNPYFHELFFDWSYIHNKKRILVKWDIIESNENIGLVVTNNHPIDEGYIEVGVLEIILSHNFAKAFWGEELISIKENNKPFVINGLLEEISWRFHLTQMVLKKEPLKYLEGYLDEK